jgi:hypothetical protein
MRILLLIGFLMLSGGARAWLNFSTFARLGATEFKARSYFGCPVTNAFPLASHKQIVRNDTLFIMLVFETRFAAAIDWGVRIDTLEQQIFDPSIDYINVSTGKVTFDTTDWALADTIWGMFDSTFTAAPPPAYTPYVSNGQLKIKGPEEVAGFGLFDMNGKLQASASGNATDAPFLAAGIYLLCIVTASGAEQTVRWYRE